MTVIDFPMRNGIPIIGFGAGTKWQWKKKTEITDFANSIDNDLVDSLKNALAAGFRHLDTAELYSTRRDIGEALRRAILDPEIPIFKRNDIFITDKYAGFSPKKINDHIQTFLPNGEVRGPINSMKSCLKEMGVDYIDLFLFHTIDVNTELDLKSQWIELIKLKEDGLVKKIGVSNYDIINLDKIKSFGIGMPEVLQIEFHPYLQNQSSGIQKYAKENGITLEAYGPLVPLTKARDEWNVLIENGEKPKGSKPPLDSILEELVDKYNVSETQILLRYTLQSGFIPITTSSKRERMDDILNIVNWELEDEDIEKINEVGNSWFYRAFLIPPAPNYDNILKKERGLIE